MLVLVLMFSADLLSDRMLASTLGLAIRTVNSHRRPSTASTRRTSRSAGAASAGSTPQTRSAPCSTVSQHCFGRQWGRGASPLFLLGADYPPTQPTNQPTDRPNRQASRTRWATAGARPPSSPWSKK